MNKSNLSLWNCLAFGIILCLLNFDLSGQNLSMSEKDLNTAVVTHYAGLDVYVFALDSQQMTERYLASGQAYIDYVETKYESMDYVQTLEIDYVNSSVTLEIDSEFGEDATLNLMKDFNENIGSISEAN